MSTYSKNCLCFYLIVVSFLAILDCTESREIQDHVEDGDLDFLFSSTQGIFAACVSSLVVLCVMVFALFKCADCYNSEVSTESHPACADSTRKWGGAVGYTANDSGRATASFGETVIPSNSVGLPYSMISTSILQQAGFQGYHTGDGASASFTPSGLAGYQNADSAGPSAPGAATGDGRHYNPVGQQQPPPPAYSDALRNSSFRGSTS